MIIALLAKWRSKDMRIILLQAGLSTILASCTVSPVVSASPQMATITVQSPQATPAPFRTPPASRVGYLTFPYRAADAGNFALQAGETITLVWQEAPLDASRFEFIFLPDGAAPYTFIGADEDSSDGASAEWLVPQDLNGSFQATAYYPDGHTVRAGASGAIYSGKLPPVAVCAISAGGAGPIDLLTEPSSDATPFAFLLPGSYAEVLQHTTDGWYLVDASEAYDQVTNLPTSGSGWISDEQLLKFHGPCDEVPRADG